MKHTQHLITYTAPVDIHVILLAKLGMSTRGIAHKTNLSLGQVRYRISKAHQLERLDKSDYYRQSWRNGTSSLAQRVVGLVEDRVAMEIARSLPPKLIAVSNAKP